ncbi:MAG TPA: protein kinase [Nannocystaceae bacterium]|nr:protein kinase [Nannocystaceae bacterium]
MIAYIIGQVLHGLSYAHKITSHRGQSLGIVHRDVSPQNIIVSVSGDVKVTDFGIAHRMIEETSGIHVKGKLRYMAPEHLGGQSHSPTVDLFAVGAILHELLDGRKFRHDADDQVQLYHQVMTGKLPVVQGEVPRELDELRVALLQADAKKRPQTADAALLMLKRWPGYSEMKVELGMICGMMTGIVRPRTGPMITGASLPPTSAPVSSPLISATASTADRPGLPQSAIATDAPAPTEVIDPEALRQLQHPKSEPTIALSGQAPTGPHGGEPALVDPRDLEPTHSSIVGPAASDPGPWGATPPADPTISRILTPAFDEPPRRRGWIVALAAAATLAVAAGGATAWVLARDEPSERVDVAVAEPQPSSVREPAAASDGPKLQPVASSPPREPVVAADPVPPPVDSAPAESAPAESAPVADASDEPAPPPAKPTPAKPAAAPKPKPSANRSSTTPVKPSEPTPTGPPVGVHFRLEDGLESVELKIAGSTVKIAPRFQSRVPAGKHAVKWRVNDGPWKNGSVVLGPGHEWKIFVGASTVRAVQM